jgi:hypothetical protein
MAERSDDLIAELVQALLDEEAARDRAGEARTKQAELLRSLRERGLRFTSVAHRVSRARGWLLTTAERVRLADRLRKRRERDRRSLSEDAYCSKQ